MSKHRNNKTQPRTFGGSGLPPWWRNVPLDMLRITTILLNQRRT